MRWIVGLGGGLLLAALVLLWWPRPSQTTALTVLNRGETLAELHLFGEGLREPVSVTGLGAGESRVLALHLAANGALRLTARAERHAITSLLTEDVDVLRGEDWVLEAGPGARYVLVRESQTPHSR